MLALRDLQQFLVLAEELNFRQAAERLRISQPTLTQTLQRLERAVGARLVERGSRHSHLTEAGRVLSDGSSLLLGDARALEHEVRSVGTGMRRQLRVGSVNPAMRTLVPQILRAVHREFPDVRISLQPSSTFDLLQALRAGRLDLAIARTDEEVPGFVGVSLMHDPLVAVLPTSHPLADHDTIQVKDLSGEAFIMAPRGRNPRFYDDVVSLYRRRGCAPSEIIEANGLHSQLALIGAEVGVAVHSLLYIDSARDDLVFVPVGEELGIPLQLLAPEDDDSAVTRHFVDAASARAAELVAAFPGRDG